MQAMAGIVAAYIPFRAYGDITGVCPVSIVGHIADCYAAVFHTVGHCAVVGGSRIGDHHRYEAADVVHGGRRRARVGNNGIRIFLHPVDGGDDDIAIGVRLQSPFPELFSGHFRRSGVIVRADAVSRRALGVFVPQFLDRLTGLPVLPGHGDGLRLLGLPVLVGGRDCDVAAIIRLDYPLVEFLSFRGCGRFGVGLTDFIYSCSLRVFPGPLDCLVGLPVLPGGCDGPGLRCPLRLIGCVCGHFFGNCRLPADKDISRPNRRSIKLRRSVPFLCFVHLIRKNLRIVHAVIVGDGPVCGGNRDAAAGSAYVAAGAG